MKKIVLLIVLTLLFIDAFSVPLRNYVLDNCRLHQSRIESISVDSIRLNELIKTAMEAVNSFEDFREFPDSLSSGIQKYPVQQLFKVFADAIISLNIKGDTIFTINRKISPPDDLYIKIEPDSLVYATPLSKDEYLSLCVRLQKELSEDNQLPNLIQLRNSKIRTVETIYLLASILRYYYFFDQLPEIAQIMITPKGLVPWELSENQRIYTSMNSNWAPYFFATNNRYNVGKFEPFMLAKKVIGDNSNTFESTTLIHNFIRKRWMDSGYFIWIKPFGEPDYSYSQYRFNRSNSASQNDKITMMLRSIGIPSISGAMYDEEKNTWINADIHDPVGNPVYVSENTLPLDFAPPLKKSSTLIENIRNIISENTSTEIDGKYIWINPSDIMVYGEDFILNKCKSGGITSIILTVKSSNGYLFYPTRSKIFSGFNQQELYRFDAISELAEKAGKFGIKVLAAVSVLNDDFSYIEGDDLAQYFIDKSSTVQANTSRISVTACSEKYKSKMIECLKEIANIPNLSGIVLGSLYMNTTKLKSNTGKDTLNIPDGNALCECYWKDSNWQSKLLSEYANDLISSVKNENKNLKVILASYPLEFSRYADFEGMQNIDLMKNLADAYLIPVGYSQWLIPELIDVPKLRPNPFKIEEYIKRVSQDCEKPIIVSFTIKDEWIFTPDFYTGLSKRMKKFGATGICFHEFNSLEGNPEGYQLWNSNPYAAIEPNPSFNVFQYSTISAMNFKKHYVPGDSKLETDLALIDFGNVTVGLQEEKFLRITNTGNKNITLKDIAFYDNVFSNSTNLKDTIIPPFGKIILKLNFKPDGSFSYNSYCIIKSDTDSTRIELSGKGRIAPIANAGANQNVFDETVVSLDGSDSYNHENSLLTYKWIAPQEIILSSNNVVNPTFKAPIVNQPTRFTFSLIVNDGVNTSDADKVEITVYHKNKPPVANAGSDQSFVSGDLVKLNGLLSTDFENSALIYYWNTPPGIKLFNNSISNPVFIAPEFAQNINFTVSLVVFDGTDYSSPDTVIISVTRKDNNIPVAVADTELVVDEGTVIHLNGLESYDLDGDSLRYYWSVDMPNSEQLSFEEYNQIPLSPMSKIIFSTNGLETKNIYGTEGTRIWICFYNNDDNLHLFKFTDQKSNPVAILMDSDKCINYFSPKPGVYEFSIDRYYKGNLHISSILSSPFSPNPFFIAPEVTSDSTIIFSLVVNDGGANSLPLKVKVTVKNVTKVGVSDLEFKSPIFMIFPNPTNGLINYKFENTQTKITGISIFNVLGDKVWERKNISDITGIIDLSKQVSGIYFIRISADEEIKTTKLILKRD